MDSTDVYSLKLSNSKAKELLEHFNDDYNALVSQLRLNKDRLILKLLEGNNVKPITFRTRTSPPKTVRSIYLFAYKIV